MLPITKANNLHCKDIKSISTFSALTDFAPLLNLLILNSQDDFITRFKTKYLFKLQSIDSLNKTALLLK